MGKMLQLCKESGGAGYPPVTLSLVGTSAKTVRLWRYVPCGWRKVALLLLEILMKRWRFTFFVICTGNKPLIVFCFLVWSGYDLMLQDEEVLCLMVMFIEYWDSFISNKNESSKHRLIKKILWFFDDNLLEIVLSSQFCLISNTIGHQQSILYHKLR